jgi:small subunit ribosomal protein S18
MAKKVQRRPRRKIVVPKKDYFVEHELTPHFSDVATLQKFTTERGKIVPRSRSGLNAKNQKRVTLEIKYARHLALMPFVVRD